MFRTEIGKIFFVVALISIGALPALARSNDEYRAAVASAAKDAEALVETTESGDAEGEALVKSIRASLPPTEKFDHDGATIEIDNRWLATALDSYESEKKRPARLRLAVLVWERLSALDERLNPKGPPSAAEPNGSKDEDKRRLNDILRRPEYQKPEEQEESWFERLMRRIREWLNEKAPQGPSIPPSAVEGVSTVSYFMQIVLYVILLAFIGFLIYRFAPLFAERFRRREHGGRGDRIVLGERLDDDADSQTLFDEAEALARAGNLRGAVRKGYVALLCELADQRVIGLAQHKTNRDYLRDVRRRESLFAPMRRMTERFERHWYGFEHVDESAWEEFKSLYRESVTEAGK